MGCKAPARDYYASAADRRKLLEQCDVPTLLNLPKELFYAQGVKGVGR